MEKYSCGFGTRLVAKASSPRTAYRRAIVKQQPCVVIYNRKWMNKNLQIKITRSGVQKEPSTEESSCHYVFLSVCGASDVADQYLCSIGYYGNEAFLHSINPKFLFYKVSQRSKFFTSDHVNNHHVKKMQRENNWRQQVKSIRTHCHLAKIRNSIQCSPRVTYIGLTYNSYQETEKLHQERALNADQFDPQMSNSSPLSTSLTVTGHFQVQKKGKFTPERVIMGKNVRSFIINCHKDRKLG
ncbi:uncharacterized protein ACMZJ9_010164 [Mantella aurantiaca]